MKKVLFLCTQNACRSQMAEGIVNNELKGKVRAFSAGTAPATVHPMAIRVMAELGIDISANRSKHVDDFKDESFDLVVTLCSGAAESCPVIAGQGVRGHRGFDDPAKEEGDEERRLDAFRRVRDEMRSELVRFVMAQLDIGE